MSRPSKLTNAQVLLARQLRDSNPEKWSAAKLAKRFSVSESTMYKVFDGSYIARADEAPVPVVTPHRPMGATPSVFKRATRFAENNLEDVDELTLAAAELIVARSNFSKMLHAH